MYRFNSFSLPTFRADKDIAICLLYFFAILMLPIGAYSKKSEEYTLKDLDQVLQKRDVSLMYKEAKIKATKDSLAKSTQAIEKFNLQRAVFRLYSAYQLDSALVYADQMLQTATTSLKEQPVFEAEALLHTARVYTHSGKYNECSKILNNEIFSANDLPSPIKEQFFNVQLYLYRALVEIKHERDEALVGIQSSLDSLVAYTPRSSNRYFINQSNKYRAENKYDEALAILLNRYPEIDNEEEKGSVSYYIALLYSLKGDKELAKKFYIISAITEMAPLGKKVYASLWELAVMLYEEGDFERAHQYIGISLQDAVYSGSHRFILKIQQEVPKVAQAYNAKISQEKDKVTKAVFIIGLLLVIMAALAFFALRQNKKLRKAKKEVNEANNELLNVNQELNHVGRELHLRNAELQLANSQLLFLNKELLEMNRVKETYLSKFIDLCADYIDKLDVYRIHLNRVVKTKGVDQLLNELKSTKQVESGFKNFLLNFDETFLKVYPSFVDDFNQLFPEEEAQILKSDELLNTELRIFALIRLGISDSNKIAKFLRCSIATVYTYRSRVKNKSLYPDDFEDHIMSCSQEIMQL